MKIQAMTRVKLPVTPLAKWKPDTLCQCIELGLKKFTQEFRLASPTGGKVDWLVGACLCVRANAVRSVGLFDQRFFMYSEELDWCRRFRAAGWGVAYVPTAEVLHSEGASSRQDLGARDRLFQASKLQYAAKWHGPGAARALRTYLIIEYLLRACEEGVKMALGSRVVERRARLRVIGSGLRHALRG